MNRVRLRRDSSAEPDGLLATAVGSETASATAAGGEAPDAPAAVSAPIAFAVAGLNASAPAAQAKLSTARQRRVPDSPRAWNRTKAEISVPATAPAVLAPYTPALTCLLSRAAAIILSSAVSVPPIAIVAGSRTTTGNAKLTAQCRLGAGSVPSSGAMIRPAAGSSQTLASPQSPITVSKT